MKCPHDSTVASEFLPELRNLCKHILFLYIAEILRAKFMRYLAHLVRDGRIFGRKIRVALSGVDDDLIVSDRSKIKIDFLHLHVTAAEIKQNRSADRAGHLIHQAGCLLPVDILRVLAHPRIVRIINLSFIEEMIDNGADEHLERCR